MTKDQHLKLVAHSLRNGGSPDLSKFTREELEQIRRYLEQMR